MGSRLFKTSGGLDPAMSWTEADINYLKFLHSKDRYFFKEIADLMGVKGNNVRHHARKMGLKLGTKVKARVGKWNSKHVHLREQAMKYFLTHTWDQTRERFGLSQSELKSLFTSCYRDPKLKHLRKDRRRHDAWTKQEMIFLLKHAGIQPRVWISKKLKRGSVHAVKESLSRLNSGSKHINGIPKQWAEKLLGEPVEGIKTKAGPNGGKSAADFRFIIVPWVRLEALMKGKRIKMEWKEAISAMAKFQRFIHGAKSDRTIVNSIKAIAEMK